MINDILSAVQERLSLKEPNIKYLDEDWGQLDYYNDNPPVQWPAALLELQSVSWKNQSQKVQDGVMSISISVADIKTTNTSFRAPATQKQTAAAIWVVLENIHKALHGWNPASNYPELRNAFGTLSRVSTQRVKRDDGIRQFIVIYSCECTDWSSMDQTYNIADPDIAASQFDTLPPDVVIDVKTGLAG